MRFYDFCVIKNIIYILASKTEASVRVNVSRGTMADPQKCFTVNFLIKLNKGYLRLLMHF